MLFSCSWSDDDLQEAPFNDLLSSLPFDNIVQLSMKIEQLLRALKDKGFDTTYNGNTLRIARNDTHCEFVTDGLSLRYPLSSSADKELRVHATYHKFLDKLCNFKDIPNSDITNSFIDTLTMAEKEELLSILQHISANETTSECPRLVHLFNLKLDSTRAKSVFQRIKSNIWHYEVAKCLDELQLHKKLSKQDTMEYFIQIYVCEASRPLDKGYLSKIWHRGQRLISITSVVGIGLLYYPELITAGSASEIRNFEEAFATIRNQQDLVSKFEAQPLTSALLKTVDAPLAETSIDTSMAVTPAVDSLSISPVDTLVSRTPVDTSMDNIVDMEKVEALIAEKDVQADDTVSDSPTVLFSDLKTKLAKKYGKSPTLMSLKKKVTHRSLLHISALLRLNRSSSDSDTQKYCLAYLQKLKKVYESKYKISLS